MGSHNLAALRQTKNAPWYDQEAFFVTNYFYVVPIL